MVATDSGFVAVGTERDGPKRFHGNIGSVWTSEDGQIWRRAASGVGPYLKHIVEHDGRLFAVSGGVHQVTAGAVWASDDAVDWEQVYVAPDDGDIAAIASDGVTLVAGSVEAMAFSSDGESWLDAPIEQVGICHCWLEDATAFDGGFLAVGAHSDRGAAWYSSDGRSWQAVPEMIDTGAYITHLRSVTPAAAGGVLVVAGTDEYAGRLYHSMDGQSFGDPVHGVDGMEVEAGSGHSMTWSTSKDELSSSATSQMDRAAIPLRPGRRHRLMHRPRPARPRPCAQERTPPSTSWWSWT